MPHNYSQAGDLVGLLRARAESQPDAPAYTLLPDSDGEPSTWTYAQLDAQARTIAGHLQSRMEVGDRALLLYPPGLDYIAAFFGCLYAGVIAVPAYPPRRNRTLGRLESIARECGARFALTTERGLMGLGQAMDGALSAGPLSVLATDTLERSAGEAWRHPSITPEQVAFLQYTSGSTSNPKGVTLTHANLLDNLESIRRSFDHHSDSSGVIWLPPYHDMGLIGGILQPLYAGFPVTLMSPFSFLKRPMRWLQTISDTRATSSGGPNFAYELCLAKATDEDISQLDLSSWRIAFTGAEPIRAETLTRFSQRFAEAGFRREAFYPCYGLAEATLMVSGGRAFAGPRVLSVDAAELSQGRIQVRDGSAGSKSLVGCGQAMVAHSLRIVDPATAEPCPAGRVGEIWVRGPSIAQSYWNRPEETQESLRAQLAGSDDGPYLRTGDLGFLVDDELYVTGRLKDLIIVQGRNLYPHDIELSAERSHPALRGGCSAAFGVESEDGEQLVIIAELERSFLRETPAREIFSAIQRAVSLDHELPVSVVELVKPGSVPKTSSGKIQRLGLRRAYLEGTTEPVDRWERTRHYDSDALNQTYIDGSFVPPRNPIEETLAEIWTEVLGLDTVGIHDTFFELGGHSLLASQALSRIGDTLKVDLDLRDFFEAPTIAQLGERIEQALTADGISRQVAVSVAPRDGPLPLAYSQERMWFIHQLQPESAAYNLCLGLRLAGDLNHSALTQAINRIVERHEILRTELRTVDGRPVQTIRPGLTLDLPLVDLSADGSEPGSNENLMTLASEFVSTPFDLAQLPLLRAVLYRLGQDDQALLIVMHHVISDAWSYSVLGRELLTLYSAFANGQEDPLPPLAIQYADFAHWQRNHFQGAELEAQMAYWRSQLEGVPVLALPTDRPRPAVQRAIGGIVVTTPNPEMMNALRGLSRTHNATLFMTLLAALDILLSRYSGQTDFAVGMPIANRHHLASEQLIGTLVNTLAMRADLSDDPSFTTLLSRVRSTSLDAFAHQDLPFEQIVLELQPERDMSHSPLFQVMFDYINVPTPAQQMGALTWSPLEVDRRAAQFDLTLAVVDTPTIQTVALEYNSDLFEQATIRRMLEQFLVLLDSVVNATDSPISRLPLLSEVERNRLLFEWNATEADYERTLTLDQAVQRQCQAHPNSTAVVCGDERLSYAELDARATELARFLQQHGVGAETPVGICLHRSPQMVIALLGVLKAGACYVPLDPAFPRERLIYMLEDSGAPILLTQVELAEWLSGESPDTAPRAICLDRDWQQIQAAEGPLQALSGAESIAYTIYTSGSTGKPKGVQIPHRAVINFLDSMRREPGLRVEDRLLSVTTLSFDIAVLELFLPLTTGAQVILVSRDVAYDGYRLAAAIETHGATVMQATPATWRMLLEAGWQGDDQLKVLCGGEALPLDLAGQLLDRVGSLWNMYGPTEATVWSSTCRIESVENGLTVGRPIANTRIYLLDEHHQPVPTGVAGELFIGGDGLARGYLNRETLTAERFVPDPFCSQPGARMYATGDLARYRADARIEVLGRLDFQVKIRGFRIELGEIETALNSLPGVANSVVVAQPDASAGHRLVAYVVAADRDQPPAVMDMRHALLAHLPDYMVPSYIVHLEQLPLTPNGKIDRLSLPRVAQSDLVLETEYVPPESPFEQTLAEICADLLELDKVSIDANFFAIGGHSLLATQFVSRIRSAFGEDVPLRVFFERPTVRELALHLGGTKAASVSEDELERMLTEIEGMSDDEVDLLLARERRQVGS